MPPRQMLGGDFKWLAKGNRVNPEKPKQEEKKIRGKELERKKRRPIKRQEKELGKEGQENTRLGTAAFHDQTHHGAQTHNHFEIL